MTLPSELSAETISAENNAARMSQADNPNPDMGNPTPVPDAPQAQPETQDAPPQLSKREQIALDHKARRAQTEADAGEITQNESGEYIPPFVAKQQQQAAEEEEERARLAAEEAAKAPAADAPKTYTLKVLGNDVPVASRDELAKLAEIDDGEADDITDAALIKLAQKQMAANALLDQARTAKKLARAVPSETEQTRSDPDFTEDQNPDPSDDDEGQTAPDQDPQAKLREIAEKIQFGDPEEAAAAIKQAVSEGVNETIVQREYNTRYERAFNVVGETARAIEAAHPDLFQDPDFSDLVYNRGFVAEVKKDLIAAGLKPENVERVVGNDVKQAMEVLLTVAASKKVPLRHPNQMFEAAVQGVRQKFNRPASARALTPGTQHARQPVQATGLHGRVDAKRALTPQPNRASAPRAVPTGPTGQAPAARANVVANMRKLRGQG